MGRPPKGENKQSVHIMVRLTEAEAELLDRVCAELKTSRATLTRDCLLAFLATEKEK